MSEQADIDTADEAPSRESKAPPRESKSRGGRLLALIALLIALLSAAAVGYLWYLQFLVQQEDTVVSVDEVDGIDQLRQQLLSQMQSADEELRTRLTSNQTAITQLKSTESLLQSRLAEMGREINSLGGTTREEWLLAEVEYLLRLASQRILMERDTTGAEALLLSADRILTEAEGITAFPVREAIARDVSALRRTPDVDATGVYVRLSALSSEIERLPLLFQEFQPESGLSADDQPESVSQAVGSAISRAGASLANLVQFRRERSQAIEPLLSPSEAGYLRANLRLTIEQAKLGLLRGNQPVYDASMKKLRGWIRRYFDIEDPATQGALKTINELTGRSVKSEMPDISGSLVVLREFVRERHAGPPPAPANAAPGKAPAAPPAKPVPQPAPAPSETAHDVKAAGALSQVKGGS